jgi:hypothetical protein
LPPHRSSRRLAAVALAAAVIGCSDTDHPGVTPPGSPARSGAEVRALGHAFHAGGGSGVVASKRYPGVLWAIRDRSATVRPGQPRNALYAYKVVGGQPREITPGMAMRVVTLPGVVAHDWEDISSDDAGNLWVGDIGDNQCDRDDTALLKVAEPDPAKDMTAKLLATYRYRFPHPKAGCVGRNAEALFLVNNQPFIIEKTTQSVVYRFPRLNRQAPVTLKPLGKLTGPDSKPTPQLSGASLSSDKRRFAVNTHAELFVYEAPDPSLNGAAFVAKLIRQPPSWTIRIGCEPCPTPTYVEGVAFTYGSHDLNLLSEDREVYWVPGSRFER